MIAAAPQLTALQRLRKLTADAWRPRARVSPDEWIEQQAAVEVVPADEQHPSMVELLATPKTLPTGGEGTGGRPWVYCVTKNGPIVRQPQQGDQVRPQCPKMLELFRQMPSSLRKTLWKSTRTFQWITLARSVDTHGVVASERINDRSEGDGG